MATALQQIILELSDVKLCIDVFPQLLWIRSLGAPAWIHRPGPPRTLQSRSHPPHLGAPPSHDSARVLLLQVPMGACSQFLFFVCCGIGESIFAGFWLGSSSVPPDTGLTMGQLAT